MCNSFETLCRNAGEISMRSFEVAGSITAKLNSMIDQCLSASEPSILLMGLQL